MQHRATAPTETELVDLRQAATLLAEARRERLTSAHLLVAMFDLAATGADLMRERRLTRDALLAAARSSTDDEPNPVREATERARRVASDVRARRVDSVHLLVALTRVRNCAAYRALNQCGVDVHGLRNAAMKAALSRAARDEHAPTPSPAAARTLHSTAPRSARSLGSSIRSNAGRPTGRAVSVPVMQLTAQLKQAAPSDPSNAPPSSRTAPSQSPPNSTAVRQAEAVRASSSAGQASNTRAKRRSRKSDFALDARRFKLLNAVCTNLCVAAERNELPTVVGRQEEVERVLDVLAKRHANSPCLVGVAGVGKTSVVQALAQRIVSDPELTESDRHIVLELSASQLLAGTQARGALAAKLAELKRELRAAEGRVVLFVDHIEQLFAADCTEELMSEFKRGLSENDFKLLGATTPEEYQRFVESDADLSRALSYVEVAEPDLEHACAVIETHASAFAEHHGVQFDEAALTYAVAWSARYVPNRALPEKALSILDLAGARASRRGKREVDPAQVASVVSELSSVPVDRLLETDADRFLRLEHSLAERVVGHEPELSRIASILRRNAAGLGGQRPIGTFLLLGPTGVGKTETAKAIAHVLFGSEHAMTRLDLSEYSEAHAVARLVGAPPGYVGFEAGGQLTEAVRRKPYQVLLLDEIEKAHQEVLETFLPLFDEGRLTDGRGHTVDFSNTVILLTSNIGAREATGEGVRRVGFGQQFSEASSSATRVIAAAKQKLSPEFFNRIDEVLVFNALREAEVEEIARRLLQRLANTVYEQRDLELCIEPAVVALLLEQGGFDAALGARPMKRAIARLVEAPLARELLSGSFGPGDRVVVDLSESGDVSFERQGVAAAE